MLWHNLLHVVSENRLNSALAELLKQLISGIKLCARTKVQNKVIFAKVLLCNVIILTIFDFPNHSIVHPLESVVSGTAGASLSRLAREVANRELS